MMGGLSKKPGLQTHTLSVSEVSHTAFSPQSVLALHSDFGLALVSRLKINKHIHAKNSKRLHPSMFSAF